MAVAAIIGDGAAGTTAAFYIRRSDPSCRIEMYCEDPTPAYYRAALTNYMLGELRAEQLFAVPPTFFQDFAISRIADGVTGIDSERRLLNLASGRRAPYDKLLVASGARPATLSFPGSDAEGFMTMRTMQDARRILDLTSSGALRRAVVVGGGILGLEVVSALRSRGVEVSYLVRGTSFMAGTLDQVASDLVFSRCRSFGVDVRLKEEVDEVESKGGRVTGVRLKSSGEVLRAGLVVVAAGIKPNIELFEGSGVRTGRGVIVDEHMATNVQDIYAAGDVTEVLDRFTGKTRLLGLWEPARHQGRVAGLNMAGGSESWTLGVNYDATRLYDLDLAVAGNAIENPDDHVLTDFPDSATSIAYRKLVIRGGKLVGALLVGHRSTGVRARGRLYRRLIASGADVSGIREALLNPYFDLKGWTESLETAPSGPGERVSRPAMRTIMGARPRAPGAPAARRSVAILLGARPEPDLPQVGSLPARGGAPARRPTLGPSALPLRAPEAAPSGVGTAFGRIATASGDRPIAGTESRIGRDPGAEVYVDDPAVSWHHALLSASGGRLYLRDLGSRNGTYVNGRRLTIPHALRDGDVIHVGGSDLKYRGEKPSGHRAWSLVVTAGPAAGRRIELETLPLVLGREDAAGVAGLADQYVSGRHLEITQRPGGEPAARDLGSRNGSRLNGIDLEADAPAEVKDGDELRLGPETVLRVELR